MSWDMFLSFVNNWSKTTLRFIALNFGYYCWFVGVVDINDVNLFVQSLPKISPNKHFPKRYIPYILYEKSPRM